MKSIKLILLIAVICGNLTKVNGQENKELITIYDKDCVYCQNLIENTYKDVFVLDKLKKYKHSLIEVNSFSGKIVSKQLNITSYPTQLAIINNDTIRVEGFLNSTQQLNFLDNPKKYYNQLVTLTNNSLTATRKITIKEDITLLPKYLIQKLCSSVDSAKKTRNKDPYQEFIKTLTRILKLKKINVENIEKYALKNIDNIICQNHNTIRTRQFNPLLKHSFDSNNYLFIESALFIKKGKYRLCNPNMNFKTLKKGEEKKETIIDFIDLLISQKSTGTAHNYHKLDVLRYKIQKCMEE